MPVPKKKHSRARQGTRRSEWKTKLFNVAKCPQCQAPILPHHACPSCGTYQGRMVLEIKEKKEKKEKKPKEQQEKKTPKAKEN